MSGRDTGQDDESWRLDPRLARIALGIPDGRAADTASRSTITAFREAMDADDGAELDLDLDDPGQRAFGDYELLELVGRGGMGVVYRAREVPLDREVAIKLLAAGTHAPEGLVDSLRAEARHAARLQHPNIVAIYGIGEHAGMIFYAMQLVRGCTLSQRIDAEGPLSPLVAAGMLRTIAEAVDYAHRLGVLHLDLKPGNILLDRSDVPLVADFGLARPLGHDEATDVSGTPGYMASEQASPGSAPLSPATDVWALGAILYEALGGRPPFQARSADETVALAREASPPALPRAAGIPPDLEAICMHCLRRDPAQRYQEARALADDLNRFLEGRPVRVRALRPWQRAIRWARREPRLAMTSAATFLALALGLTATAVQWRRAETGAADARRHAWNARDDAAWRAIESGRPADAQRLLLENLAEREHAGDREGAELERLRLGSLRYRVPQLIDAIATGAEGRALAIDPRGERVVASIGNEELRMYRVGDGQELWRTAIRNASGFWPQGALWRVAFTRDGRHLIADRGEPEVIARPAGHDNILVDADDGRVVLPPADRFPDFRDATYSADGRFAVLRNHAGQAQLFRVEDWQSLTPRRGFGRSNDMWRVGDDARFVAVNDLAKLELWDPASFETRYTLAFESGNAALAWDAQPGGALLALGYGDGQVQLLDCDRLSLRDLRPAPAQRIQWLSFSRDGRWLAAVGSDSAFLWDVATGRGAALPARPASGHRVVDVDAVAGTVLATGGYDSVLWRLPVAGSVETGMQLAAASAGELVAQFPAGGLVMPHALAVNPASRLAASLDVDGELRLWRWREPGALDARNAPGAALGQHFDGRHVAVVEGDAARVVRIEDGAAASPELRHPQPVSLAALAADGETLVTVNGRELRAFDWRTGGTRFPPIQLAATPLRVALSPDARFVLTAIGDHRGGRFRELLSVHGLDGTPHARDVPVAGPLAGMRFDASGRRLLLWRGHDAWLHDVPSLRRVGSPMSFAIEVPSLPGSDDAASAPARRLVAGEIQDALYSGEDGLVTAITRVSPANNRSLGATADPATAGIVRTLELGGVSAIALLDSGDAPEAIVQEQRQPYRIDGMGRSHALPLLPGELLLPHASGGDGRWLATTTTYAVVLTDRRSGTWASAPLPAPLPPEDAIAQLWLSSDTSRLLARSQHGRWLWWSLEPESRRQSHMAADIDRLQPSRQQRSPAAPPRWHRASLRALDPGAPARSAHSANARPPTPLAAPAGFAFVDLAPAINRHPGSTDIVHGDSLGYFASVPVGIQRFLGIDFDVRGVVALKMRGWPQQEDTPPWRSPAVRPPVGGFDAVHLLLGACCMLQGQPPGSDYGFVVFEYADGSVSRAPIRYHLDVREPWTDPGDDLPARTAWVESAPRAYLDLRPGFRLYAARFANPHPARAVAALRFEAGDLAWSGPLIFAATVETGARVALQQGPQAPD